MRRDAPCTPAGDRLHPVLYPFDVREFFGIDSDWRRPPPGPGWWRLDLSIALGLFLLSMLGVEALRASQVEVALSRSSWQQVLWTGSAAVILIWRRRFPVTVMILLTGVHFVLAGNFATETTATYGSLVLYFTAMSSAFSWAQDRLKLLLAAGGILVVMAGWLTKMLAMSNALDKLRSEPPTGLLTPLTAIAIWSIATNLVFFAGAILCGQLIWRNARSTALLLEQSSVLKDQSEQLAHHAVLNERLRIARELHDIVAHHISVIGVQASATRRALAKRPELAEQGLGVIEQSARDAITEMRVLLTALRTPADQTRQPTPTLEQLPAALSAAERSGLSVDYRLVDPEGISRTVPTSIQATIYRTIQEALTNIRKHSTANSATIVLRFEHGQVETEVTDSGRPRETTSGTGFGLQGLKERIQAAGGSFEIGPRASIGFRVRTRLPLEIR